MAHRVLLQRKRDYKKNINCIVEGKEVTTAEGIHGAYSYIHRIIHYSSNKEQITIPSYLNVTDVSQSILSRDYGII